MGFKCDSLQRFVFAASCLREAGMSMDSYQYANSNKHQQASFIADRLLLTKKAAGFTGGRDMIDIR